MKAADPRVQKFFWEQYLAAIRGNAESRRLVDGLDETAGLIGCWPDELWVLRGCFVFSQVRRGASASELTNSLPDLAIGEVTFYLAEAGLVRLAGSDGGGALWTPTDDGRVLLGRHQAEAEPAAAAARFLRGEVRTGALAPWRPRLMSPPTNVRRRRKGGRKDRKDPAHIPNRYLTAHRIAAGFVRAEEFAEAIGLSERQLTRIEAGEFIGGLGHYVLAARLLGCRVDDLVADMLRYAPVPWARKEWRLQERKDPGTTASAEMPSLLRFPPD